MEEKKYYSSRIIKSYVEYLKKFFPDIDANPLLKHAGIEIFQLDDEGHWMTQEESDRFHEMLVKATQDPDISRKVGRFSVTSRASGAVGQYILGFINPATAYGVMEKINSRLSRAANLKTRAIASDKIEAKVTLEPGVNERLYQCNYRLGAMEALAKLSTNKLASIEHPVCVHRGGDCCLYVISWEKTPSLMWKRIRNYISLIGLGICIVALRFVPTVYWDAMVLLYFILLIGLTLQTEHLEKKELLSAINTQADAADRLMDQINSRYNEALLIQEIGQAASMGIDIGKLLKHVMKSLIVRLDFDRGMIMLANEEKNLLVYSVSHGYNPKDESYLKNIAFHLDNPHSKGAAVEAFRKQKPVLINDISLVEKDMSSRTLAFVRDMGSQSFICVPIVYKGESMGILMVDNVQTKKPLGQTEMNLLMGIAPQIGISIRNAVSYQKIRESEERYRTIFESTATANIIVAEDSTILMANNNFVNLCGYLKQELEGKMKWEIFIHPDDLGKMKIYHSARRKRHRSAPPSSYEFRAVNRNGDVLDLMMSVALIPDKKESIISMIDLSGKKKLESQLLQSQKMESVGQLAGGVAHDFNNMLSVIIGNAEIALNRVQNTDPVHKHLKQIMSAGMRSADLTRQLLAFARKQTVTPKILNLNDTVESMLKMLRRLIGEDINLVWLPGKMIWPVKMDPTQIDQIMANLCVNARDAIKDGGKVNIETGTCSFDEAYCAYHAGFVPGDYVLLTVSDTGCGMDKKTMDNIFDPFFTTKEVGQGTGLGLSTVYGIVKQNNGFINVYSEPGLGTTFKIFLPRYVGDVVPIQKEDVVEPPMAGNEVILLVEDEPSILEMTSTILENLGYTVLSAVTPGEAIRLAGEHNSPIDLLLTDVVMPGMNGRDLAQNMMHFHPGIKHLFMSGYTADVIAHQDVLDEGVNFIQKPFSAKGLAEKVREVLSISN
ncbi:MAG TPA: PAS domain S-box protein [Smithellaceae bacterium]|nr:PAS domain S-box protein [Smithellaceae bacterium]